MIEGITAIVQLFAIFGGLAVASALVCGLAFKFGDAVKHWSKWF